MDWDLVAQHARTIKETYQQYIGLLKQKQEQIQQGMLDQNLEDKIDQTRQYLLKLTAMMQKAVDEERENVYG